MLTYNFSNIGSDSLYEYLYKCIKNDILLGNIRPGEKLPSKRTFAKNLGISVITVENAYAQLVAEGYLYSMPKRGFYAADLEIEDSMRDAVPKEILQVANGETSYFADFSSNQTDSEIFPFTIWTRTVRAVLNDNRIQLMINSPCAGILKLRSAIVKYLREFRGMQVLPEQIIVGAGTEYLHNLLIQLLGNDLVYGVEDPGYHKIARIYERYKLNKELAQMLKGGVIMDVTTPEQAHIAEEAGACAVMALERIPADIRAAGGVSRMSDPKMIRGIQEAVSIPVMAKCRIGHFVEAQVLEAIEIDYIDESEVLSPADDVYHINKRNFKVPFVCGAKDLGEALRRINEGASMIRTKGEPGTGDIVQAVRHMRKMNSEIQKLTSMREDELFEAAKVLQVPYDLVQYIHDNGRLPVVNFAAGGVATPADAALMMQLGAEGVFVGSGIFKSGNPAKRAASIVKAVTNYTDARLIAELSADLGEAMVGINEQEIALLMAERGK